MKLRLAATRLALALLGPFATHAAAQAPSVHTVLNNGTTQSRYDIVVLGDGYQAGEQAQFDADVLTFLAGLFQKQPYQTFAAYYNVHTVFRASVDSGADHPDVQPPVYKNTVYDAGYATGGVGRCLYIQNTSQALADAALAPATEGCVLVLVNDGRYGGCSGAFAVSYNGPLMVEVLPHELGHALASLADEYGIPNTTYLGPEPAPVNITTDPLGQKWSHWRGGGIRAFEGAGLHQHGLYRPDRDCLMRSNGVPLCAVCTEAVATIMNSVVDTITSFAPVTATLVIQQPSLQQFSISHIVPASNNPAVTWRVDGNAVPGAQSTTFVLDSTQLSLGQHTVDALVLDRTTFVRNDPTQTMLETRTWQVTVTNPAACQLRIPTFWANPMWVTRGSNIVLSATIANDGPAAAPPFDVEFFLTPSPVWTTNDIYLGKLTVNSLAALNSVSLQHPVQLPWSLPPQAHFAYAVVDRNGAALENNEDDNERNVLLLVQTSACVTKLEFDDPLVYPRDNADLSVASGGVLHPMVVATCVSPGTLYLVVWGGSGTSPGLPLGPGVTLPLNPDGLTQVGLAGLNGPVFGQFLGATDVRGLGRATFALPPSLPLSAGTTHFAAVLLGGPQLFSAATDAIALVLTQ